MAGFSMTITERHDYARAAGLVTGEQVTWLGEPNGRQYRIAATIEYVTSKGFVRIRIEHPISGRVPSKKLVQPTSLCLGWPDTEVTW